MRKLKELIRVFLEDVKANNLLKDAIKADMTGIGAMKAVVEKIKEQNFPERHHLRDIAVEIMTEADFDTQVINRAYQEITTGKPYWLVEDPKDWKATKAETVVKSHLSDAPMDNEIGQGTQAWQRVKFVKFLVHKLEGDLNQTINPELAWDQFLAEWEEVPA